MRLDIATVPGDPRGDRRLAFLELHEGTAMPDQLLGQRTHLVERLVRLLDAEVTLLHARMIRPLCARVNGFGSHGPRLAICPPNTPWQSIA
jgi:hypothetical protein